MPIPGETPGTAEEPGNRRLGRALGNRYRSWGKLRETAEEPGNRRLGRVLVTGTDPGGNSGKRLESRATGAPDGYLDRMHLGDDFGKRLENRVTGPPDGYLDWVPLSGATPGTAGKPGNRRLGRVPGSSGRSGSAGQPSNRSASIAGPGEAPASHTCRGLASFCAQNSFSVH